MNLNSLKKGICFKDLRVKVEVAYFWCSKKTFVHIEKVKLDIHDPTEAIEKQFETAPHKNL